MEMIPLTRFFCSVLAAIAAPLCGNAVTVSTPELPQNAFALAIKEPAQSFYCRDARKITHISLQKYITEQISEGSRVSVQPQYVTEVTIDFSDSPLQIRIYAMEEFDPLRLAKKTSSYNAVRSRTKGAINSLTKSNVADIVQYIPVKTYPLSTHAKTVEFRIPSAEEIEEFYKLINVYYLRDRADYRYFGAVGSPASKIINQKNFLGLQNPCPSRDWSEAVIAKKATRTEDRIVVSGLSGLLFTLGTPDTVATEIERQDVNKEKK